MANVSVAAAFVALSDPTRRQIFERLAQRNRSVGELAEGLPVTRPAVSQHLRVLTDAGLVTHERDGARRVYRIDPRGLQMMRAYLDRFWDRALLAFQAAVDEEEKGGRK
ncbi:MAG TPA: metalloregulator ArsR/SmtB family transcription factor [Polyangia bacterium]|nr:metalloregulator ArsR/SmtB family transcription factor [Polyangia bacterium]